MDRQRIPFSIEQSKEEFILNTKKWKLVGWSRAGLATGFILYPHKILIDCGLVTSSKFDDILITHQHVDHTQATINICSRRKLTPTNIHIPYSSIKFLTNYFRSISELSDPINVFKSDKELLEYQNVVMCPIISSTDKNKIIKNFNLLSYVMNNSYSLFAYIINNSYSLFASIIGINNKKKLIDTCNDNKKSIDINNINNLMNNAVDKMTINNLEIEILHAYHTVQTVGYGFKSNKKVFKDEYNYLINELSNDDKNKMTTEEIKLNRLFKINKIKELKANNIELTNNIKINEFCFFCDSTIDNLTKHDEWKKYPVIICECTGLDIDCMTLNRDYDRNHTSIITLKPIMLANKDKKWCLIHISAAVSSERIKIIESQLINEGIDVYIFGK